MKIHPVAMIGLAVVSAVTGYHFRSGFPGVGTEAETGPLGSSDPAASAENPPPRRSLAAIEAENEIRRLVEEKEMTLAAEPAEEASEALDVPPVAVEKVSAAPFYDELAPHGEWLQADGYGDVWQPEYAHDSDWRPYVDGGWDYTDAGWTWDSDEPCGDITCHYGRWVDLSDCGWCWVPGYEWAPAWVSWRCSDEFIGWAPLPPCVPWRPAVGLGPWVDACGDLGPGSYCFVPARHFAAANCRPVLCARGESADHFCHTRNSTHLFCRPGPDGRSRPVLEGPDVQRIAALSPKDLRHRRLQWVEASRDRRATPVDREVLPMRRLAFAASKNPTSAPAHSAKELRRLDHVVLANPWREAGDPQIRATARRQVFAEAHETFRGLPRLVPPVETPPSAAARQPSEKARVTQTGVVESVHAPAPVHPPRVATTSPRDLPATDQAEPPSRVIAAAKPVAASAGPRAARESLPAEARPAPRTTLAAAQLEPAVTPAVTQRLEPAVALDSRHPTGNRPALEAAESVNAQASRQQDVQEALRQRRAAETRAVELQRPQEQQSAIAQQQVQQDQQRQALTAQRAKDDRDRQLSEQHSQQARNQALIEQQQQQQQQRQAETERRALVENQRLQAEARQQQEMARRQQIEQAHQQAALQARQQQEAQQREQLEQSRRQAEIQARQIAAEQQRRENDARQQFEARQQQLEAQRQQQVEAQRRQAEEGQRRQQAQEAQERNGQAARQQQQQAEAAQRQAEAGRQREQEAARQHAEHAQEKRGK